MFKKTKVCSAVMIAMGGGLVLGVSTASAQDQQLQRVEVTGSAIKRVEVEGALPVTVITREQIERTGATSTEQLLQSITANSSLGGTQNSTGASVSTYGYSSISLRGLGEQRTLVLLNGRRLASFAGAGNAGSGGSVVNVNAIPLAAIERVEVLKDGASAIYGSDAVAGVVNFILKKGFQGVELGASYGQPTRSGGGKSSRASIVTGFGDPSTDRFSVTISAAFEKETELYSKDRSFAKTGNIPGIIASGATGQGNIEGAWTPATATTPGARVPGFGASPGTGYGNPLAASNQCESINMFLYPDPTSKGGPYCQFDSAAYLALVPKRELAAFTGNASFKLTENAELFSDLLYSRSVVTQIIQPNPIRNSFLVTDSLFEARGVDPVLLLYPSNPNYSIAANYLNANGFGSLVTSGKPLAVTARVFDFGLRQQRDTSEQTRLVFGGRGTFLSQDWEAAFSFNESKLRGTVPAGYFSQIGYVQTVQQSTDWNPWSLNQSDAFNSALAANDVAYTGDTLKSKTRANIIDAKVSGEVFNLPAGPLLYALGAQGRRETLVFNPSDALSSGDIAGLGGAIPPIDKDRTVTALVGEVSIPIVKGLEAGAAVRTDKYSQVGSARTYKASLRYQPVPQVLLRAGMGTGFRAPTLQDLYLPQAEGTSEQFNDPATGQTDLQVNQTTGGNPNLKPERSRQASLGIVLQPIPQLSASVDYWRVKLNDILSTPSAQEVVSRYRAGDPAYAGLVTIDPTTNDVTHIVTTQQNTGNAKVQGVDIEVDYRETFGPGKLLVNMSGTYMMNFDQTSPGGQLSHKVGTLVDSNGDPVLDAQNGGIVLRWKHILTATWLQGPWAFTVAQNYYSGYNDGWDLNDNPHSIGAQALYDAQVAFTGVKNLKLALGVRNLMDKDPPVYIPVSNQFQAGYDASLYDPRSRFVYLNATYKF